MNAQPTAKIGLTGPYANCWTPVMTVTSWSHSVTPCVGVPDGMCGGPYGWLDNGRSAERRADPGHDELQPGRERRILGRRPFPHPLRQVRQAVEIHRVPGRRRLFLEHEAGDVAHHRVAGVRGD